MAKASDSTLWQNLALLWDRFKEVEMWQVGRGIKCLRETRFGWSRVCGLHLWTLIFQRVCEGAGYG